MKTPLFTGYFALIVAGIAGYGILSQLSDLAHGTATPFTFLAIGLCGGLLGFAYRLWCQRRWAVVLFTLGALLDAFIPHRSPLCLAHALLGAFVLATRWRELRSGI